MHRLTDFRKEELAFASAYLQGMCDSSVAQHNAMLLVVCRAHTVPPNVPPTTEISAIIRNGKAEVTSHGTRRVQQCQLSRQSCMPTIAHQQVCIQTNLTQGIQYLTFTQKRPCTCIFQSWDLFEILHNIFVYAQVPRHVSFVGL
jgi:hypothetical protein